ncbi:tetratricopeptide repeat protein [bacterium]|nr:tetratricopeptide repeat protein [bacterium]
MGRKAALFPLACLAVLALTRCASSGPASDQLMEANQRLTQQVTDERSRLKRLQRVIEEQEAPTVDAFAPPPRLPLTVLKPAIEKVPAEETSEIESEPEHAVATSEHEVLTWYRQGLEMVKQRQYDAAVSAFRAFLTQAPEHVYADRAEYWIGQSYFLNREYGLALTVQNRLLTEYPFSVRAPEALYGAALSNLALGQTSAARTLLRDFLRQYPTQPLSEAVSRKLAELTNANPNTRR